MERNDKSKRMKTQIVVKQEDEDNLFVGASEGLEVVPLSNRNYFTPPLMDVWPEILGHVTAPKDFFSVINSAPVFRSMLENRKATALLPLVLPILMEKEHLESHDILNCRLVSKSVKEGLDDAIVDQRPYEWIREGTYLLFDHDYYQYHANAVQPLVDLPDDFTGNPFILRYAKLDLDEAAWEAHYFENILRILQRFGHELYRVHLVMEKHHCCPTQVPILEQILSYLPNVKILKLVFGDYFMDEVEPCNNNLSSSHPQFPVLKSLERLEIGYTNVDRDDDDDKPLATPSSAVAPIFLEYRMQITSLSCKSFVFRGVDWKSLRFPQLRKLVVDFQTYEGNSEIFRNIAKLDCPLLESLTLLELIETREMFDALNSFRNSLKELRLYVIWEGHLKLSLMAPANIREFPQMTTLVLNIIDVGTKWMHLFRVMFTKLEEIHFERKSWPCPPTCLEKIENEYFPIFPNLKRCIIWKSGTCHNEGVKMLRRM